MYQEIILDHYRNPRNFGSLVEPHICHRETNPLCGDVVEVQINLADGAISQACFQGKGCAISQAATSMLMEHVQGKKISDLHKLSKEEMLDLLGIPVSYARLKCALLGLKVLKTGLIMHEAEKEQSSLAVSQIVLSEL